MVTSIPTFGRAYGCVFFSPQILMDRGYEAEFRGLIAVKGKGEMKTYFVVGKKGAVANALSRQSSQISSLATVVYGMVQARRRQNTVKKRHFHRECASANITNSYYRGKVFFVFVLFFIFFTHSFDVACWPSLKNFNGQCVL